TWKEQKGPPLLGRASAGSSQTLEVRGLHESIDAREPQIPTFAPFELPEVNGCRQIDVTSACSPWVREVSGSVMPPVFQPIENRGMGHDIQRRLPSSFDRYDRAVSRERYEYRYTSLVALVPPGRPAGPRRGVSPDSEIVPLEE